MNERQKEEYRRLTNQPDKMDFTGDEHIPPGTNRQPFSKTSDEVAFPCGHTVAHEEDCPRCEVERLRRELGLKDALIDALTDCIGPEDGQTFEERAEELIVTEVAYQNSRAAPETCDVATLLRRARDSVAFQAVHRPHNDALKILLRDIDNAVFPTGAQRAELKAFVQLCAPHGQDWLTCPECAKAAGIEEAR